MTSIIKNKIVFNGVIAALLTATVAFGVAAYNKKNSDAHLLHGSVDKGYSTVNELASDSEIIAKVKISDSQNIVFEKVPFTVSKAQVKELYKGAGKSDITILQTGGVIDGKKFSFEGSDPLAKDNDAIVYLKKYNGPVVAGEAYVITGVYAGKFKLDNKGNIEKDHAKEGELKEAKEVKDLKLK